MSLHELQKPYRPSPIKFPEPKYMGNHGNSFLSFGAPALPVGGWVELDRTTLGATSDSIEVNAFADKRYLMYLYDLIPSGAITDKMQGGNTTYLTTNEYAQRLSLDGAADSTSVNAGNIDVGFSGSSQNKFGVGYWGNISAKEKLLLGHSVDRSASGSGTPPSRSENFAKMVLTSNPIDRLKMINTGAGDYAANSELVILEWDPADIHTTNFWEELASVTGGATTQISSGTITAKKYLWVQLFTAAASQDTKITFNNDTASNYSRRRSANGGADATLVNRTSIELTPNSPAFINMFIINNSAEEKLVIVHHTYNPTSGAGTAPNRWELAAKWDNTAAQITEIDWDNDSTSVNFGTSSFMRVFGAN